MDRPGGRLRARDLAAAREALEAGGLPYMDERAVNAALGLPPPLRQDERDAPNLQRLAPAYRSQAEVLAYVVSRLVPDYSAASRVLDELRAATQPAAQAAEAAWGAGAPPGPGAQLPVWRPREVLVHGAGAGAAVWAVLEAWPRDVRSLVAVETSTLRQVLGARLERAHRAELAYGQGGGTGRGAAAAGGDPRVSWVGGLAPLSKAAAGQRRRYDLVVAPYQLSLLPTAEERQRLVKQLWDRCGGVLVLIEPGTPRGFADVAEARQLLLGAEARKRAQLSAAAAADGSPDPRVAEKLRDAGAHVLAPCPHDEACPMQGDRRAWCHFGQPLVRPRFMQLAKRPPPAAGGAEERRAADRGASPSNLQDERFSYIIIRRGPRPDTRVAVAREYAHSGRAAPRTPRREQEPWTGQEEAQLERQRAAASSVRLPSRVVLHQVALNRAAVAAGMEAGTVGAEEVAGHSAAAGPAAHAAAPRGRAPLFAEVERRGSGSALAPTPAPAQQGAAEQGLGAGAGEAAGPATATFVRKYPAYGPGLVGRLMAMRDAGVDWAQVSAVGAAGEQDDEDEGESEEGLAELEAHLEAMAAAREPAKGPPTRVEGPATAATSGGGGGGARDVGLHASVAEVALDVAQQLQPTPREEAGPVGRAGPGQEHATSGPVVQGVPYEWQALTRAHVSDEEYGAAEAQLLQRIYGTAGGGGAGEQDRAAARVSLEEGDEEGGGWEDEDDEDAPAWRERGPGAGARALLPPPLAAAAADASLSWGRVIRPPRRRGKHVILDLCCGPPRPYADSDVHEDGADGQGADVDGERVAAAGAADSGSGTRGGPGGVAEEEQGREAEAGEAGGSSDGADTAGRLVRQVVAKSAAHSWMGRPAYKLARRLQWGDTWPDWYTRHHNAQVVGAAAKGGHGQSSVDSM